jgi:hypothetical protein
MMKNIYLRILFKCSTPTGYKILIGYLDTMSYPLRGKESIKGSLNIIVLPVLQSVGCDLPFQN